MPVTILTALVFLLGLNACLPLGPEGRCPDAGQERTPRLAWPSLLSFLLSPREPVLPFQRPWVLTVGSCSAQVPSCSRPTPCHRYTGGPVPGPVLLRLLWLLLCASVRKRHSDVQQGLVLGMGPPRRLGPWGVRGRRVTKRPSRQQNVVPDKYQRQSDGALNCP